MSPSVPVPLSVPTFAFLTGALLTGAILLGACSNEATTTGATSTTSSTGSIETTTADVYEPVVEPADCPDPTIPLDRFDCGQLVLPEDRSAVDERQVELPVLRISPSSGPVGGPPVVYLHGGPGSSGVDSWATWMSLVDGLGRDLVLYDQRGGGRSTPRLDCPEHDTAMVRVLADTGGWSDERDLIADALTACHERLIGAGIHLDRYDTATSVQDLDDLRRALGTGTMTLVATSYGTRLALAYLETHAERLESLVLDSVDVPGTGGPERDRELLPAAIDRFISSCRADAACGAAHPDLAGDLERASSRLDGRPVQLPVAASDDSPATTVSVSGDELHGGLFAALYDTDLIPLVPAAIESLAAGDDALLDAIGSRLGRSLFANATGALMSVNCADHGVAALESDDSRRLAATDPGRARMTVLLGSDSFCDSWPVPAATIGFDPTTALATVPALVIAGQLDPITPADESRRTADLLDAHHLEIARGGHAPMLTHGCALAALEAFLADPDAGPRQCTADPAPFG